MGFLGDKQYTKIERAVYPWSTHKWGPPSRSRPETSICEWCGAVKAVWNDAVVIVTDVRGRAIHDEECELAPVGEIMES